MDVCCKDGFIAGSGRGSDPKRPELKCSLPNEGGAEIQPATWRSAKGGNGMPWCQIGTYLRTFTHTLVKQILMLEPSSGKGCTKATEKDDCTADEECLKREKQCSLRQCPPLSCLHGSFKPHDVATGRCGMATSPVAAANDTVVASADTRVGCEGSFTCHPVSDYRELHSADVLTHCGTSGKPTAYKILRARSSPKT